MSKGRFFTPILAGAVDSMNVDFSASTQSTEIGSTVSFTNLSDPTPDFNFWDFGDGDFSTASAPDKVYTNNGTYSITLNAMDATSGGIETKTDYIVIDVPSFDTDAVDYISRVETADAETLEIGIQVAINNLVVELKDEGLWNDITQLVLTCGARTLTGALEPLKGVAPGTWGGTSSLYNRKTGLKGDKSNVIDTNIASNSLPNNLHTSLWITEQRSGTAFEVYLGSGIFQSGLKLIQMIHASGTTVLASRVNSDTSILTDVGLNLYATSRLDNTSVQIYSSGVLNNITDNNIGTTDITTNVIIFGRGTPTSSSDRSNPRIRHWSLGNNLDLIKLNTSLSNYYNKLDNILS